MIKNNINKIILNEIIHIRFLKLNIEDIDPFKICIWLIF